MQISLNSEQLLIRLLAAYQLLNVGSKTFGTSGEMYCRPSLCPADAEQARALSVDGSVHGAIHLQ